MRPRLFVVETQGVFFVVLYAAGFFLFCTRRGEIHSLTGASAKPRGCKKSRGQEAQKPKNQEAKEAEAEKPEGQKLKKPRSQGNQEAKKPGKTRRQYTPSHEVVRSPEARKPRNRKAKKQKKYLNKNKKYLTKIGFHIIFCICIHIYIYIYIYTYVYVCMYVCMYIQECVKRFELTAGSVFGSSSSALNPKPLNHRRDRSPSTLSSPVQNPRITRV